MGLQKLITLIKLMSRAKLEIERFRKPKSAAKIPETKSKIVAQIRKAECQGPKLSTHSEKSSLLCAEFDSALFAFCEIQVCVFVNSSLPYGKLSLHRQKNEVWVFKNSSLRLFENSSLYQKNKGVGHWSTCEKRKPYK